MLLRRLTTGPPSSKLGLLFEAASTASGAPTKWRSREAVDPPDELAQRFQRARDERARADATRGFVVTETCEGRRAR